MKSGILISKCENAAITYKTVKNFLSLLNTKRLTLIFAIQLLCIFVSWKNRSTTFTQTGESIPYYSIGTTLYRMYT